MMRLTLTVLLISVLRVFAYSAVQDVIELETEARRAVESGQLAEALDIYEQLGTLDPDNSEFHVWSGRLSRWLGDLEGAARHLDIVLDAEPNHVEAAVEKAYVLMAQQSFPDAAGILIPIATRSGNNVDVLMALARLYRYQGDDARAREYVSQVLETDPDHSEARDLDRNIAAALDADRRVSITLGYGHDQFTFASPGHHAELTGSYIGDRSRFDLRLEAWDKFGSRSERVGPAVSHRFGERLWLRGSAMWARHAQVLPRQSASAGLSLAFPGGWVVSGDYRHLRFEDPVVHVVSPALEYYFERPAWIRLAFFRSWSHHRISPTPDVTDNAFAVQYNHRFGTRMTGFAGYARGNESYADLSIDRVGSIAANTYSVGGTLALSNTISTRVFYSYREASGGNDQNSFGVSLTLLR